MVLLWVPNELSVALDAANVSGPSVDLCGGSLRAAQKTSAL
jgi:hypothetical protein